MDDAAVLATFFKRHLDDRVAGRVSSLQDYQSLFPGYEELIAREYQALERGEILETQGNEAQEDAGRLIAGRYRIVRELARGGQGEVYLADDERLDRKVALKVIRGLGTLSTEIMRRFRREAEVASRLQHPGLCTVHDSGVESGLAFIAMQHVEGESLAQAIRKRREASHPQGPNTRPQILETVALIEKAARAVHVAHEAGIVHRDIKPSNIMVAPSGEPVMLDFGLASDLTADEPTLTRTGDLFGTPAYMSPEQLARGSSKIDRRTDVWSLGVTLFECLTLTQPFRSPTREGLSHSILTDDPADVRTLNPAIAGDLRVVLGVALEKDRDRRYQTALDLAEDLRRVRQHEPVLAKPMGPLLRLRRWSQRNPQLATAVAGLFLVLATGLTIALILLGKAERERVDKEKALGEKGKAVELLTTERNDKQAALDDYERLADVSRRQELETSSQSLWPALPDKIPAMKSWLESAALLEKSFPGHRETLAKLRAAALPASEEDLAQDQAVDATRRARLGELEVDRSKILAMLKSLEEGPKADWQDRERSLSLASLTEVDWEIAALRSRIGSREHFRFAERKDQFKHDTLARLVSDIEAFLYPDPKKGTLASVQARLRFAESVESETLVKPAARWTEAIASIADPEKCPRYGGRLKLSPQLGLIPIGQDPASGLWEFAHFGTTAPGADPIPKRLKDGQLRVFDTAGLVFVLVPGGTFQMGAVRPSEDQALSDPNVDAEAEPNEGPVTTVSLDPFFISKFEMSQSQWTRLVGTNPSDFGYAKYAVGKPVSLRRPVPVETVSWEDCELWLGRLGLALPTEAQWEYAARGGTTTPRWFGIGTQGIEKVANLADAYCRANGGHPYFKYEAWDDGFTSQAPCGVFAPNPFGLHEVLGNLWEWCRDSLANYDSVAAPGDGLRRGPNPLNMVIRGASYGSSASFARSAHRFGYSTQLRRADVGVRPMRKLSAP